MTGSQIFLINLTNRRIPANPNYHMSIKKTQAILQCFIHLKYSAWFTLGSENETMFCDTWNLFISCLHFAACGHCCVVHRTEKYACFIRVGIISLPPFRLNNCIVHWFSSPNMQNYISSVIRAKLWIFKHVTVINFNPCTDRTSPAS